MMATLSQFKIRDDFIFDPYLALYLPLYELDGASFMSKDAYGHLCTVSGAIWTPRGRDFDGTDDFINCGTHSSLDIAGVITLEAWIKPDATALQSIFNAGGGVNDCYCIYTRTTANQMFSFRMNIGGTRYEITAGNYVTTRYQHVAAVFHSTSEMYIYIDGVPHTTTITTTSTARNFTGPLIGKISDGSQPFNGKIGEARIYSRALSHLEVQHNYLATKWRYR